MTFEKVAINSFVEEFVKVAEANGWDHDEVIASLEMMKEAGIFNSMAQKITPSLNRAGQAISRGATAVGQGLQNGLQATGDAIWNTGQSAASKYKNMVGKVNHYGEKMQKSKSPFRQGMGRAIAHAGSSPGVFALEAANPVGSAANILASGVGESATQGLARAGTAMAERYRQSDPDMRFAQGLTIGGKVRRTVGDLGNAVQRTFSPGGYGHTGLTKVMPAAAHIGGAAGVGAALHVPTGAAGLLGKGMVEGARAAAPALVSAVSDAVPIASSLAGAASKAPGALGGALGGTVGHLAEDYLGTKAQNYLAGRAGVNLNPAGHH